jgi:threonyl-tRNA synthetase
MASSEIHVTLPDGSARALPAGATGADLARAIGPGLAKAAIAARVNGEVHDLGRALPDGATVAILTERDSQALDVLRHSSAHVLATAVRQLFPHAKIGFGPAIEDGFYYDFEVPAPFTPEDLSRIEARMHEVAEADYPFVREEVSREEAKRRFVDDPLKLERIDDLGPNEVISVYTDGPFVDLCRASSDDHRAGAAREAAARGRRLLAWRRAAPDAAADLRHGLVHETGSGPVPASARGGPQARSSHHRQTARLVLD